MKRISIAIDGPSSSGKSTVAKLIANKLKIEYVDSGAMYRYVAYISLEHKIDLDDESAIVNEISKLQFEFIDQELFVNKNKVGQEIRTPEVTMAASKIATLVEVRKALVIKQQELAQKCSVIMDGRDVATYILPNADFKFYLTASVESRAQRRLKEYLEKNIEISLEQLIKDQEQRDYADMNREYAPLVQADDAIVIDSSNLNIDETVAQIVAVVSNHK